MSTGTIVVLCIVSFVVGGGAIGAGMFFMGVNYRKKIAEGEIGSAEEQAKRIINDAYKNAEARKKEIIVEAREEIQKLRSDAERYVKERRAEVAREERPIQQKVEALDR